MSTTPKAYDVTDMRETRSRKFDTEDGDMAVLTVPLGKAICDALGAPEKTRSIHLDFPTDGIVEVTYVTIVSAEKLRKLGLVLAEQCDRDS